MIRARTVAACHAAAHRAALDAAWDNPEPSSDPHGDQRWREAELASAHYAAMTPERRAELEAEL